MPTQQPTPADTIYALATPPGVGALAVVRVSGSLVRAALTSLGVTRDLLPRVATLVKLYAPMIRSSDEPMIRSSDEPMNRLSDDQMVLDHRRIGLSDDRIIGLSDHLIDHALVTYFPAPHSFTGEDVVELSLHGGRAVVRGVMDALSTVPGLRLADPGEFTRRAFLNGKMDLTGAEAIADLIHAETALQRVQALGQMEGNLRDVYDAWRDDLIRASAYIEAHLDFVDEEDVPDNVMDPVRPALDKLRTAIAKHLNDGRRGEMIRDGVRVVILGAPNAGKSTLLNALVKREAAIVSEHAGTTRDVIDVHLDLDGVAVILTDTAGLRARALRTDVAADVIERVGIDRALQRAGQADLKLILIDATSGAVDDETRALIDDASMVVWTKMDQVVRDDPHAAPNDLLPGVATHAISVKTGVGMDDFMTALTARVHDLVACGGEGATLTRERHRVALTECARALDAALGQPIDRESAPTPAESNRPPLAPELMAEELRRATIALGRLTGRVDVEDVLEVIFRDFCIGK